MRKAKGYANSLESSVSDWILHEQHKAACDLCLQYSKGWYTYMQLHGHLNSGSTGAGRTGDSDSRRARLRQAGTLYTGA